MKVLLIENYYYDLIRSRVPLGEFLEMQGIEMAYACPDPKSGNVNAISMNRNSLRIIELLEGVRALRFLENQFKSDVVLSFRFIPNVLNYLSSLFCADIKRIAVITGLGYAFNKSEMIFPYGFKRYLIILFYKLASKRLTVVVQNHDDLGELGIPNGKVILGSGVNDRSDDIQSFTHTEEIVLLFVGRLLKSKGLLVAVDVFKAFKVRRPNTRLIIAGSIDKTNPDSLNTKDLERITRIDGINYLGYVSDMNMIYRECNVLIFPSVYREGIPRVILESLMYGLTIITKDMPGCKETVNDNGFLIKENHSVNDIVNYLDSLDSTVLATNKNNSRRLFKDFFSSEVIYRQYLDLIR